MASNRVMIVDDQQIFRVMLREILSDVPDIDIVGEASGGQEAVDMARDLRPDVVLMDIELNTRMNGIQAGKAIKTNRPTTGIVLFSTHKSNEFIVNAPGWSYLLKNNLGNIETLINAINGAAWGLQIIDPEVVEAIESGECDLIGGPDDFDDAIALITRSIEELGISVNNEPIENAAERGYVDNARVRDAAYSFTVNPLEQMSPEQRSKIIQFTLEGYVDEYISNELRVNVKQVQDWRDLIAEDLGIEQIEGIDPRYRFIEGYVNYNRQLQATEPDYTGVEQNTRLLDLNGMPNEGKEVLKLVAQGWSNAQIATKLQISESIVQEYLDIIYSILGIRSNEQIDPRSVAARVYLEQSSEKQSEGH